MKKFENIEEIAERLCVHDLYNSMIYKIVDALIEIAKDGNVDKYDDWHFGLKGRLSNEFLQSSIYEINESQFESEIEILIEQANAIFSVIER